MFWQLKLNWKNILYLETEEVPDISFGTWVFFQTKIKNWHRQVKQNKVEYFPLCKIMWPYPNLTTHCYEAEKKDKILILRGSTTGEKEA